MVRTSSIAARAGRPSPARFSLDRFLPYGMIGPAVFVAFAIAIVPLLYAYLAVVAGLVHAAAADAGLRRPDQFRRALPRRRLWAAFGRTWIWTIGTVLVELALAMPIALLLNRETAMARTASALILVPWVTPFIVLGFGWRFLLDSDVGPIHLLLHAIGLAGNTSVLNDPVGALRDHHLHLGLEGHAVHGDRAARRAEVDPGRALRGGRSRWRRPAWSRFRHVTVPAIWNTVVTVGLVLGILAFYSFDLAWIMTKGGPQDATTIVGIAMYKAVFLDLRPAYAAAISVVMLVLLFVASILVLQLRRR